MTGLKPGRRSIGFFERGAALARWLLPAIPAVLLIPFACYGAAPQTADSRTGAPAVSSVSIEAVEVVPGRTEHWADIGVKVAIKTANEDASGIASAKKNSVTVKARAPDYIAIEPGSHVVEVAGSGVVAVTFRAHSETGKWPDPEEVGITVEMADKAQVWQDQAAVVWPPTLKKEAFFHTPDPWFVVIVLVLCAAVWYRFRYVSPRPSWTWLRDPRAWVDLAVLSVVAVFLVSHLNPGFLLISTTTTGGDTASHFYTLSYLKNVLLPAGLVSGWTPGNYAGFPILQFYFPLNFLFMVFMSGVVSLQVAFKLGSIAGILLLPFSAYAFVRMLRCPFPGPGIAAALTLPFLFNASHSMWGGNILSSFAGEFSYGLSMSLSLFLLGSLYRGVRDNSGVVRNAILVFLVGFSHGYTLLFAEAMSAALLFTQHSFLRRCFYLGRVYVLAFCLLAFWLVPLLVFTRYTIPYDIAWDIQSWREIFPVLLMPSLVIAAVGTLGLYIAGILRHDTVGREILPALGYLWFGIAMTTVFFAIAPRIGVVDIRYVPYAHLLASLLAAVALGWLGWSFRKWKADWALMALAVAATLWWVAANPGPAAQWAKWNYEGFEAKSAWRTFEQINQALKGDFNDPRVVFEHSQLHNAFGSSRAFESLPLFAGRATLEGLYMQASISAPFVFYIQSEISEQKSAPFPRYIYGEMDFDRARSHLELFNARDLIIRSDAAKQAIRETAGYRLKHTVGDYELWELTTVNGAYVEPLEFHPALLPSSDWKRDSHDWFRTMEASGTHLVFTDVDVSEPFAPFPALTQAVDRIPRIPVRGSPCSVDSVVHDQRIEIETDCIGRPLLVKMSYHPNWHVDGAERIWRVSPSFMLIYPDRKHVTLTYGPGRWDRLGRILSLGALAVLMLNLPLPGGPGRTGWRWVVQRMPFGPPQIPAIRFNPSPGARRAAMVTVSVLASIVVGWGSWYVYYSDPDRMYQHAIELKDEGRYEEARESFERASRELRSPGRVREAAYYVAVTWYLEKKDTEAVAAFREFVQRFPRAQRVPEAEYHIGICLARSGNTEEGIETLEKLRADYPQSEWAAYARERLQEFGVIEPAARDLSPETIDLRMGVAVNHFNNDRLEQARPIFAEIVEKFPDHEYAPQALAALALTWFKTGDCTQAAQHHQSLVNRYPQHDLAAEALYHLGLCAERSADATAAQGYYQRLVREYPDTVYAEQARIRTP